MIIEDARILTNEMIAKDVYRMRLTTAIAPLVSCGQFVQVQVPGFFLRRPISVCFCKEDILTLVYKTVGEGTLQMSLMQKGETLSLLGPLGNGFPVEDRDVLLIGGGVGIPPLLYTAKKYIENNRHVTAVLGFNDSESILLKEEFEQLGCQVLIATMDGSSGTKGTVIDAIVQNDVHEKFVCACGPHMMLKAVCETYSDGYISLESRMACGFGACMGCVVKDADEESFRVCKDGPVFKIGKVVL